MQVPTTGGGRGSIALTRTLDLAERIKWTLTVVGV